MGFTISAGQTQAVIAIARDADGQPVEMASASWSEASAAISVTPGDGMAATIGASAPGSGSVSVELASISEPVYKVRGSVAVTVPDVSQITFSASPLLLDLGQQVTLTATARDLLGVAHASLALTHIGWRVAGAGGATEPTDVVTVSPATGSLAPTITAVQPGTVVLTCYGTRGTDNTEVSGNVSVHVAGAVSVGIVAAS